MNQYLLLQNVICDLTAKWVIEEVTSDSKGQFISTLFVLQQKNKTRPVFNFKPLNTFVESTKFKTEGLTLLRTTLCQNDYMMELDLQDAHYSIPITKEYRKYLRFTFDNVTYKFQCLPFGLSSAPRTFTKVFKPVIALVGKRGLRVIIYLDDLLLTHQEKNEPTQSFNEVYLLFCDLGFIIKKETCSTTPLQSIVFPGALFISNNMTMEVPSAKLQDLKCEAQTLNEKKVCTIQELSSILGRMTKVSKIGLTTAPLHYRALQQQYIMVVHKYGDPGPEKLINLTSKALADLQW